MEDENRGPVLYKCPYCSKGRFWDWDVAVAHIKEKHVRDNDRRSRRKRRNDRFRTDDDDQLLASPPSGYNGGQETYLMA